LSLPKYLPSTATHKASQSIATNGLVVLTIWVQNNKSSTSGNDCNALLKYLLPENEEVIENKLTMHITTNLSASEIETTTATAPL
jgi:hypothetical protein